MLKLNNIILTVFLFNVHAIFCLDKDFVVTPDIVTIVDFNRFTTDAPASPPVLIKAVEDTRPTILVDEHTPESFTPPSPTANPQKDACITALVLAFRVAKNPFDVSDDTRIEVHTNTKSAINTNPWATGGQGLELIPGTDYRVACNYKIKGFGNKVRTSRLLIGANLGEAMLESDELKKLDRTHPEVRSVIKGSMAAPKPLETFFDYDWGDA